MNNAKSKWAKTRLTAPEFAALRVRADAAGLTVSEYLRAAVLEDRSRFDVQSALHSLEQRLRGVAGAGAIEVLLVEAVLLGREALARHNAQALSQIQAKLDARFPGRERLP